VTVRLHLRSPSTGRADSRAAVWYYRRARSIALRPPRPPMLVTMHFKGKFTQWLCIFHTSARNRGVRSVGTASIRRLHTAGIGKSDASVMVNTRHRVVARRHASTSRPLRRVGLTGINALASVTAVAQARKPSSARDALGTTIAGKHRTCIHLRHLASRRGVATYPHPHQTCKAAVARGRAITRRDYAALGNTSRSVAT